MTPTFEFEATPLTVTPGRLRGQIRKLLESTDIKITELQRMLGVNANSYGKFMNGKYKDPWAATQNGTYHAAAYFFFREKMLGKNALGKTRAHGGAAAAAGKPKLPDLGIETTARGSRRARCGASCARCCRRTTRASRRSRASPTCRTRAS